MLILLNNRGIFMKRLFFVCFSLMFLQGQSVYSAEGNFVEINKPDFSFRLPGGWIEIPSEVIIAANDKIKQQAPAGANVPVYDYGFQRDPVNNWMEYPYILVQVMNTGRIPEYQLKSMPKLTEEQQNKAASLSPAISSIEMGQTYYDEAAHVVWMTAQSDIAGIGKVANLTGMIPTQKGFVIMHAYSPAEAFQTYVPLFQKIISSTAINPNIAYNPNFNDLSPTERIVSKGISGAISGAVLGGLVGGIGALSYFFKKRKKDKNKKL